MNVPCWLCHDEMIKSRGRSKLGHRKLLSAVSNADISEMQKTVRLERDQRFRDTVIGIAEVLQ
jgi:hypothetical protein